MSKKPKKEKRYDHVRLYFVLCTTMILAVTLGASGLLTTLLEFLTKEEFVLPTVSWMILISVLLGGVISLLMSEIFLSPIKRLSEAMRQVAAGDFTVHLDHKKRIGEMRESFENFNTMVRALGATETLQSDFVSNVSHEFKTPINAVEGYVMLLQDGDVPETQRKEYMDRILLNTRRLSELVNNILLLSKVDNQTIAPKKTAYRLDEQLRQALLMLERKWSEKNLELDVELDSLAFQGDEALLQHVWINLMDNAIKFTPEGGMICLRCEERGENVIVSVADSGAGMTQEEMEKIFDRFYQADGSHQGEGNGLGLALVQKIVHVCGGSISVESRPGAGSRFTVTLPKE